MAFGLAIVFSFLIFILFFVTKKEASESDFKTYLGAASIVKNGLGGKLYDLQTIKLYQEKVIDDAYEILLPFRYPLFAVLLFTPFTFVSLLVGFKLFALLNLGLLVYLARFASFLLPKIRQNYLWLLIPILYLPNLYSIFYGQVTIFLALIVFLVYFFIKSKKDFAAGLLASLLFIKPHYLLLTPFIFVISKDKKSLIKGFVTSTLLLFVVSILLAGPHFIGDYLKLILATENEIYGTRIHGMYSLIAALLFVSGQLKLVNTTFVLGLILLGYSIVFYFFRKNYKRIRLEWNFVFMAFAFLLFSRHVFTQDLTILTFPLLFILFILNEVLVKGLRQHFSLFIWLVLSCLLPTTSLLSGNNLILKLRNTSLCSFMGIL